MVLYLTDVFLDNYAYITHIIVFLGLCYTNTRYLQQLFTNRFFLHFIFLVDGIQCYQCSSEEDEFCPAFGKFDETKNALVDCFSLESYVPGHMCMKMVKESYDSFYGKRIL